MQCNTCNKQQWRLCSKGGYDQRIILIFSFLTLLTLLAGVLIILYIDGDLRTALAFILGGMFSVSLRSLVAELIAYFRRKIPDVKDMCHCHFKHHKEVKSK